MKLTLSDLAKKRDQLAKEEHDPTRALSKWLSWLIENEDIMNTEAKNSAKEIEHWFWRNAQDNASLMPDSPEKRMALRGSSYGLGEHTRVVDHLVQLASKPAEDIEELQTSLIIAERSLQTFADFLFDTRQGTLKKELFVASTLLHQCLDEFFAAYHLVSCKYFIQANAHLRIVYETIDLAKLFVTNPEKIKFWTDGDWRERNLHFSPSKVRKDLGKKNFDPIYAFLSENGGHPTFEMFKQKTVLQKDHWHTSESIPNRKTAILFIGGTKIESTMVMSCASLVLVDAENSPPAPSIRGLADNSPFSRKRDRDAVVNNRKDKPENRCAIRRSFFVVSISLDSTDSLMVC